MNSIITKAHDTQGQERIKNYVCKKKTTVKLQYIVTKMFIILSFVILMLEIVKKHITDRNKKKIKKSHT